MNKKYLPGELALVHCTDYQQSGVCLMAKSGFGISTISSAKAICIQ